MNLYVLVENFDREFREKLFLAAGLVERGAVGEVLVGNQLYLLSALVNGTLPAGIILFKSTPIYLEAKVRKLKQQGHVLVLQDEESLLSFEEPFVSRNDVATLRYFDAVMCSHQAEADYFLERSTFCNAPVALAGNMRLAALRSPIVECLYGAEITEIKEKYGRFILFSSTFCQAFRAYPSSYRELLAIEFDAEKVSHEVAQKYLSWAEEVRFTFYAFCEFVRLVSIRKPDWRFILRPHPSDDVEFLRFVFQDLPNILIVKEYSIGPWIHASDLVIGSTCTTLLEAREASKPAISFLPDSPGEFTEYLKTIPPNSLLPVVQTPEELISEIERQLASIPATKQGQKESALKDGHRLDTVDVYYSTLNSLLAGRKEHKTKSLRRFVMTGRPYKWYLRAASIGYGSVLNIAGRFKIDKAWHLSEAIEVVSQRILSNSFKSTGLSCERVTGEVVRIYRKVQRASS